MMLGARRLASFPRQKHAWRGSLPIGSRHSPAPGTVGRRGVAISADRLEEFVRAELTVFAKRKDRPLRPIKLEEVVEVSSSLAAVAQLVHDELPVRFARRVKNMEAIADWESIPELKALHDMHVKSFRELRLADPTEMDTYPGVIMEIRHRHRRIPLLFAEAIQQVTSAPQVDGADPAECDDSAINFWALNFLSSRVSTEILMSHYIACVQAENYQNSTDSALAKETGGARVGIIDLECDPWIICQQAIEQVRDDDRWPTVIESESAPGLQTHFCYAPVYLYYIVKEMVKNSTLAMHENSKTTEDLQKNPVRVTVAADDRQVIIRISDRAGGIPADLASQIWSCKKVRGTSKPEECSASSAMNYKILDEEVEGTAPKFVGRHIGGQKINPLVGKGIGLIMCRLYASYLGGSLELINMPGIGVDSYLFLNKMQAPAPDSWKLGG